MRVCPALTTKGEKKEQEGNSHVVQEPPPGAQRNRIIIDKVLERAASEQGLLSGAQRAALHSPCAAPYKEDTVSPRDVLPEARRSSSRTFLSLLHCVLHSQREIKQAQLALEGTSFWHIYIL